MKILFENMTQVHAKGVGKCEFRTRTAFRDLLLPKPISGVLRVKEAECIVRRGTE